MRRPEYDYRSIREPQPSPEQNPTYRTALNRFNQLRDRYLATQDEQVARQLWNQHDTLHTLLRLGGKFPLGRELATPGALEAMREQFNFPVEFMLRHRNGDWSEMDDHDQQANEQAIEDGSRILSSYNMRKEGNLWLITESDRSATTILLPEEY